MNLLTKEQAQELHDNILGYLKINPNASNLRISINIGSETVKMANKAGLKIPAGYEKGYRKINNELYVLRTNLRNPLKLSVYLYMNLPEPIHGGRRPGSGRKKVPGDTARITFIIRKDKIRQAKELINPIIKQLNAVE